MDSEIRNSGRYNFDFCRWGWLAALLDGTIHFMLSSLLFEFAGGLIIISVDYRGSNACTTVIVIGRIVGINTVIISSTMA